MAKTIEVAADRARRGDDTVTITPREIAKSYHVANAPGADALKLFNQLIRAAGERMGDDVEHTARLADLNADKGTRNHSRQHIQPLMLELAGAVLCYDDTNNQRLSLASLIPEMHVNYRHEDTGHILIAWRFGASFRKMAKKSHHWAEIDRMTLLALRSKYSVLLFQHMSALFKLTKVDSETFTVQDLRDAIGVPKGKLKRFSHLNDQALKPAIKEINLISRFTLTASLHKKGRTVTAVMISWAEKPAMQKRKAKAELDRHSTGRKHRLAGTDERIAEHPPFPDNPKMFRHSNFWVQVYHDAGCRADMTMTAQGFINWTVATGKPRSPQLFFNFCKGENTRRGIQ
ncbi:MAG: replication initiation protein [Boseongicola sp. SB0673_bin_14]|nr:replication initiation protein [Boseongicola sp. SB0667_bin_21]MYI68699.1 replication initiation protein [Boseongicola sp. SB0673_bin_14]